MPDILLGNIISTEGKDDNLETPGAELIVEFVEGIKIAEGWRWTIEGDVGKDNKFFTFESFEVNWLTISPFGLNVKEIA